LKPDYEGFAFFPPLRAAEAAHCPAIWASLWHRGLAEDIEELWEPWMRPVDERLEDEELLDTGDEAQGERHPQSRIRGRM